MLKSRKDKLDQHFLLAEQVVKRLYPDGKINVDELTAISVAHFSNYLPEILPEARPLLARLISYILDLESHYDDVIGEIKLDDSSKSEQQEVAREGDIPASKSNTTDNNSTG